MPDKSPPQCYTMSSLHREQPLAAECYQHLLAQIMGELVAAFPVWQRVLLEWAYSNFSPVHITFSR